METTGRVKLGTGDVDENWRALDREAWEALGLLSTLAPRVEITPRQPMAMARKIVDFVDKETARLHGLVNAGRDESFLILEDSTRRMDEMATELLACRAALRSYVLRFGATQSELDHGSESEVSKCLEPGDRVIVRPPEAFTKKTAGAGPEESESSN